MLHDVKTDATEPGASDTPLSQQQLIEAVVSAERLANVARAAENSARQGRIDADDAARRAWTALRNHQDELVAAAMKER
jgi:hypothetical protein